MPEPFILHVRKRLGSDIDPATRPDARIDGELVGDAAFIAEQVDVLLGDPCLVSFELVPRPTLRVGPTRQTSE